MFALGVPGVVAPLGSRLRGRRRDAVASLVTAGVAAPTFIWHRGALAGAFVVPWLAVAATVAARDCRRALTDRSQFVMAAASVFLVASAASLLGSRLGV